MSILAPIVLFVYNRPEHTAKTIQALQKNVLASESELIIYADAAKNDAAQEKVDKVGELLTNISGFKKVTIIKQDKNIGLANSIISGVTENVNKYGSVIVLEDDLVTSPYFLTYMNDALNLYADKKNVWHISGWNYPIDDDGLGDTFLWRTMNCWGWATWSDRWQHFEKNTDNLIASFSKDNKYQFNLDGAEDFWGQVLANKKGKINTWAIYWYATIFKNKGLCLNPVVTYVNNIGFDGSGVHCGVSDTYHSPLNVGKKIKFESELNENEYALSRIQRFYKKSKKTFIQKLIHKTCRIITERNIFK
ncbi:glycosyltransferase family protein [Vibrio hibernica]|uniref:glycosyltransferase n=1 Tax=Vibrio hibernica TaxID=2587465 RepID=UPI001880A19D|nr:glycosyltransferase [Vibrio hibernica]